MKMGIVARAATALLLAAGAPGIAFAQGTPGSEVIGQPIQVTTNGVTNTVYLDPGGQLRVLASDGTTTVPGTWNIANGQLCLGVNGAQECVPYSDPFQAGQPKTLTSSCNATETWLAQATNEASQGVKGERGR
jgi:hypothetical protein